MVARTSRSGPADIPVKGYVRKDGVSVAPYTRIRRDAEKTLPMEALWRAPAGDAEAPPAPAKSRRKPRP